MTLFLKHALEIKLSSNCRSTFRFSAVPLSQLSDFTENKCIIKLHVDRFFYFFKIRNSHLCLNYNKIILYPNQSPQFLFRWLIPSNQQIETFQFKVIYVKVVHNKNKYLAILRTNIGTYLQSVIEPTQLATSLCRRQFRNNRKATFIATHFNLLFRTAWYQTTNL
jgi:hypothetical protein